MTLPAVVLLVEDSDLTREVLADVLREEGGFSVIEAASAAEGVALLEDRPDIAALVADVGLPDLGGVALARLARERRGGLPIVLVSGRPLAGDLPVGARFLEKPFRPVALIDALGEALSTPLPSSVVLPFAPMVAHWSD